MDIRRLPGEEPALRRFIEDLLLPYYRELEEIVDRFALEEDVDFVGEELEYRLDLHESETFRAWVAVDGSGDEQALADPDGEFAGFVTTDVDEASTLFDRPDRLVVCDLYVREADRGTGLARDLVDRARTAARDQKCPELNLEVDGDNERALAFYEKLGFDPVRYTMAAGVDAV